ncbi:MAG TPA: hypothetical protein VH834_25750 [Solirubrobacteraceae bacterium]|jgi:hypothetical protein
MRGAVLSWTLAALAAIALAIAGLLFYAEHAVFSSDGFADRTAAALERAPVRDAAARRLAGAAIAAKPDLVALRPIIELGAGAVVGTDAFRSLARRAVYDAHRSAFDREHTSVTVQIRDAGVLLAAAVRRLRPDASASFPTNVAVRVARIKGGVDGFMLGLAEAADRARPVPWIALGLGVLLALGALLAGDSRRAAVVRLGLALAAVAGVVALGAALLPSMAAAQVGERDRDAARAVARIWTAPIVTWALAAAFVGVLVALAAASVVRAVAVVPIARRAWDWLTAPPRSGLERALRIAAVAGLGAAMVAWPRAVLTLAIAALGVVLLLAAFSEVLAMVGGEPAAPRAAARGVPRAVGIGAVVAVFALGAVAAAAVVTGGEPDAPRVGRCNGHAALCDRRLDEVAFFGTHNAMAGADEPGWFFAAQDTGIPGQLQYGVRAFTIDTHYAVPSSRGVWTDLSGETKSRAKLIDQLGDAFVAAAERARARIGRRPSGARHVFLCHAFCEVGATRAVDALTSIHRFLVRNPEEVVILSIEDDTSAEATAAIIRASGLVDEVYRGDAKPPWPTLRELVDRDERVIVLAENHGGGEPWIHHQPVVMQETPFHFTSAAQLAAPESCAPNRGGTAGSLFLVNHWVDTSPAPRVSIAREVNARDFMTRRLSMCRRDRRKFPNVVAVDFYRQGDTRAVVDELNGVG